MTSAVSLRSSESGPVDPLSEILALLAPHGCKVGGFEASGDWAVRFDVHDGIKCYAVTEGGGWLAVDGHAPVWLAAGDCFMLPRGLPFVVASDLTLPPRDFHDYLHTRPPGGLIRVNGGGEVMVVGGFFALEGPHTGMLLSMLPPIILLKSEADKQALRWSFDRMRQELSHPQPGSGLITQQLASMILVQAIRLHLAEEAGRRPGWLFALADKAAGAAIGAMHGDPARRWTVEALASHVGMSRSSFAARFKKVVGEAPMEYLTRWRMVLARHRLATTAEPVGRVAAALGYESESAFSTAFKRQMGCSPRQSVRMAA